MRVSKTVRRKPAHHHIFAHLVNNQQKISGIKLQFAFKPVSYLRRWRRKFITAPPPFFHLLQVECQITCPNMENQVKHEKSTVLHLHYYQHNKILFPMAMWSARWPIIGKLNKQYIYLVYSTRTKQKKTAMNINFNVMNESCQFKNNNTHRKGIAYYACAFAFTEIILMCNYLCKFSLAHWSERF